MTHVVECHVHGDILVAVRVGRSDAGAETEHFPLCTVEHETDKCPVLSVLTVCTIPEIILRESTVIEQGTVLPQHLKQDLVIVILPAVLVVYHGERLVGEAADTDCERTSQPLHLLLVLEVGHLLRTGGHLGPGRNLRDNIV